MDILMLTAIAGLLSGSPAHAADAEQVAYTACAKDYKEHFSKIAGKKAIVCGWSEGGPTSFTRISKKGISSAETDALVACLDAFKAVKRSGAAFHCKPFASGDGAVVARMSDWATKAEANNGRTQLSRIQHQIKKIKQNQGQAKPEQPPKAKPAHIRTPQQAPVQRVPREFEVNPRAEPLSLNDLLPVLEAPLQNVLRNYPSHRPQYPAVIPTQPVSVSVSTPRPPTYGAPRQTCVWGPNTGSCAIR